eukprot:scaffold10206_cov100-Isochrysis_galbana.AAC.3
MPGAAVKFDSGAFGSAESGTLRGGALCAPPHPYPDYPRSHNRSRNGVGRPRRLNLRENRRSGAFTWEERVRWGRFPRRSIALSFEIARAVPRRQAAAAGSRLAPGAMEAQGEPAACCSCP